MSPVTLDRHPFGSRWTRPPSAAFPPDRIHRAHREHADMKNHRYARVRGWPIPMDLLVITVLAAIGYVIALSRTGVPHPMPEAIDGFLLAINPPSMVVVTAGIALAFILPGYATLAALLPNRPGESSPLAVGRIQAIEPLSPTERIALSFGVSLGMLGILGLTIEESTWHFSSVVGGGLLLLTVVIGTVIGSLRGHVPPFDRQGDRFGHTLRFFTGEGRSTVERAVSIGLALSILLAFVTLSGSLLVPRTGESYTGMSLLLTARDGGAVAADYPSSLVQNEPTEFVVLVQNREHSATVYTLVVTEQRVTSDGGAAGVAQEMELSRRAVQVAAGEDERIRLDVAPTMTGSDQRIAFYLYRGSAPADVTDRAGYRQLYVWVDVHDASWSS